MAQGTPRKFAEKIAIMERKQNEDQEVFTSVMRDVRAITSNCTAAPPVCSSPQALAPPIHWTRSGGSLPNVHEMVQQQPNIRNWPYWPGSPQINPSHHGRGRTPGAAHYHPYKPSKQHERFSPLDQFDYQPLHCPSSNQLVPPDTLWPKARSDPTIFMNLYQQQRLENFDVQNVTLLSSNQHLSPLEHQSLSSFHPTTDSFNGLEQKNIHDSKEIAAVGSLPDIPRPTTAGQSCAYHHQTVAQRHSTSLCQTLATPPSSSESQSAPTSPAQSVELPVPASWPQRNYSNSPEPREIPNIVLTGTDGQLDCFQDLQDLHLDANELQQLLSSGGQVDPTCETQLLE
uniref:Transducer of regulated CREB activity N-terminal domain-containing protein n=1 Tax=Setaria digitata TaxID=48799 RepID=A0A915Q5M6_9BILA